MTVHTIDLEFLGLKRAIAAFAVEGPEGVILIETGPHTTVAFLEEQLRQKGWQSEDFHAVFLSHIHFDHAGAAWVWAQRGARIYVHPIGAPHLSAPDKLYQSARRIYGGEMERLWGTMAPISPQQLYTPEHGEEIRVAGLRLRAWHTPGHAPHHIAWEVSAPGEVPVLFTGDVAGVCIDARYVAPPCPPPDIDVEAWQASIALMRALPAQTLYLTHFGCVQDKERHLRDLEHRLLAWASWMRPYAGQDVAPQEVIPAFVAFVQQDLAAAGIDAPTAAIYEAANPAFMSVAGLLRYWKKKWTA